MLARSRERKRLKSGRELRQSEVDVTANEVCVRPAWAVWRCGRTGPFDDRRPGRIVAPTNGSGRRRAMPAATQ
jgi:hypothetical protein